MTEISKRRQAELAGQAMKYVAELLLIEPLSPAFDHKLEAVEAIGRNEIAQLTARTAGSLAHVGAPPLAGIGQAIAGLRSLAASLEPMRQGNLAGGTRRWGILPAKADPKAYFARYRDAQAAIESALSALARGRDGLLRANVGIEGEQAALTPLLAALEEHAVFAEHLALTLAARADMLEPREPMKARRLTADALSAVQTRMRAIAEARALAAQGLMLRSIVSDTNARLIEGIDHAIATMVLVLKTAIHAARLLAQQELVLDGIASLRQATNRLIEDDFPAEADRAEALQTAFARLYEALEQLETERAVTGARLGAALR